MRRVVSETSPRLANCVKRCLNGASQWLQTRRRESTHCRECDEPIRPFDDTCPRCGVHSPAAVHISPVVPVAVVGLSVLLILLTAL